MSDGGVISGGVLVFCIGALLGSYVMDSVWTKDCAKAAVHVSGERVFDCKERK